MPDESSPRRASQRRRRPRTGQARCGSQGWPWSGGGGPRAAASRATPAILLEGESFLLPGAAVVFGQKVQTLDPVQRLNHSFREVVVLLLALSSVVQPPLVSTGDFTSKSVS